ncbi:MAG: c-type cytochrome [Verrucomicrobia bacterium]|nr:c-type cytochrome [Verrucomicrobiota bacterium]
MSADLFQFLAVAEPAGRIFQWRPFLAPFHSVVLHYPIGFVTLVFILELYHHWRPSRELRKTISLVTVLSLAGALVAAALGWLRATGGGYEQRTLELHRWLGVAVPACIVVIYAAQRFAFREAAGRLTVGFYRAAIAGTLVVIVIAGHQGGNLTHGSKYLVENAPDFIKTLMEEIESEEAASPANGEPGGIYAGKIRPIFEAKCAQCHGAEKQKGSYRMDKEELVLKGGESERPAIKPGEPLQSNLVRLITLPRGHDDVMPPDGKEPLTPEEIMAVVHWIQAGAQFGEAAPKPVSVDKDK